MKPLYVLLCIGAITSSVNTISTGFKRSLSSLSAKTLQHCPINQVYKECKGCELKCEDIAARRICPDVCIPGCTCADGYVKNPNGKCVRQKDCPDPYKPFPELPLAPSPKTCSINEEYRECKGCDQTCDKPYGPIACPKICLQGCACKAGFVRDVEGKCILPLQCKKNSLIPMIKPSSIPPRVYGSQVCPSNEVYSSCKKCEQGCPGIDLLVKCTKDCRPGCSCEPGFVRYSGVCIPSFKCPVTDDKPRENLGVGSNNCPVNEEFSACLPCNEECPGFGYNTCPYSCIIGCACKLGFSRSTNGKCIPTIQCPQIDPVPIRSPLYPQPPPIYPPTHPPTYPKPPHVDIVRRFSASQYTDPLQPSKTYNAPVNKGTICPANEEYKECGGCEQTCESLYTQMGCAAVCIVGCQCEKGYVRDNGACIPSYQCPQTQPVPSDPYPPIPLGPYLESPQVDINCDIPVVKTNVCPVNEVFTDCLPCNEQCPGLGSDICTLQCTSGCSCQPGHYRMESGRCIPSLQCPNIDPIPIDPYPDIIHLPLEEPKSKKCGVNEQYTTCGGCEETCQSLTEPLFCSAVCVVGCQCMPGYVRDEGVCVEPSHCPVGSPVDLSSIKTLSSTVDTPELELYWPIVKHTDKEVTLSNVGEEKSVDIEKSLTVGKESVGIEGPFTDEESESMTCPVHEVFRQCKGCDQTCESLNNPFMCSMICIAGCSCVPGFVRKDGVCVEPNKCPIKSSSVLEDKDIGSYDQILGLPDEFNLENLELISDNFSLQAA